MNFPFNDHQSFYCFSNDYQAVNFDHLDKLMENENYIKDLSPWIRKNITQLQKIHGKDVINAHSKKSKSMASDSTDESIHDNQTSQAHNTHVCEAPRYSTYSQLFYSDTSFKIQLNLRHQNHKQIEQEILDENHIVLQKMMPITRTIYQLWLEYLTPARIYNQLLLQILCYGIKTIDHLKEQSNVIQSSASLRKQNKRYSYNLRNNVFSMYCHDDMFSDSYDDVHVYYWYLKTFGINLMNYTHLLYSSISSNTNVVYDDEYIHELLHDRSLKTHKKLQQCWNYFARDFSLSQQLLLETAIKTIIYRRSGIWFQYLVFRDQGCKMTMHTTDTSTLRNTKQLTDILMERLSYVMYYVESFDEYYSQHILHCIDKIKHLKSILAQVVLPQLNQSMDVTQERLKEMLLHDIDVTELKFDINKKPLKPLSESINNVIHIHDPTFSKTQTIKKVHCVSPTHVCNSTDKTYRDSDALSTSNSSVCTNSSTLKRDAIISDTLLQQSTVSNEHINHHIIACTLNNSDDCPPSKSSSVINKMYLQQCGDNQTVNVAHLATNLFYKQFLERLYAYPACQQLSTSPSHLFSNLCFYIDTITDMHFVRPCTSLVKSKKNKLVTGYRPKLFNYYRIKTENNQLIQEFYYFLDLPSHPMQAYEFYLSVDQFTKRLETFYGFFDTLMYLTFHPVFLHGHYTVNHTFFKYKCAKRQTVSLSEQDNDHVADNTLQKFVIRASYTMPSNIVLTTYANNLILINDDLAYLFPSKTTTKECMEILETCSYSQHYKFISPYYKAAPIRIESFFLESCWSHAYEHNTWASYVDDPMKKIFKNTALHLIGHELYMSVTLSVKSNEKFAYYKKKWIKECWNVHSAIERFKFHTYGQIRNKLCEMDDKSNIKDKTLEFYPNLSKQEMLDRFLKFVGESTWTSHLCDFVDRMKQTYLLYYQLGSKIWNTQAIQLISQPIRLLVSTRTIEKDENISCCYNADYMLLMYFKFEEHEVASLNYLMFDDTEFVQKLAKYIPYSAVQQVELTLNLAEDYRMMDKYICLSWKAVYDEYNRLDANVHHNDRP